MKMAGKFVFRGLGAALAAALVFAATGRLAADVYLRGPKITGGYAAAGLSQIHKATMDINGEPATMEVFAAYGDAVAVAAQFSEAVKEKTPRAWFSLQPGAAFGFAQQDDRLTRFLFVQMDNGQTLLYALHQSYPPKQSPRAAEALPSDFPVYPGAQPAMAIHHRETRARMAAYYAGATTAVAEAYYQQALAERGWKALPVSTMAERSPRGCSQQMYRRGNAVCVINYEPVPVTGQVMITVLMKDSIL